MSGLQNGISGIELINAEGFEDNFKRYEEFMTLEKNFLHHLEQFDKEYAQKTVRQLIDILSEEIKKEGRVVFKYYLSTLYSIIARELIKKQHSTEKAVGYNATAYMIIETKLGENNAINIADELIELYFFMLVDKRPQTHMHTTVNKVLEHIDQEVEKLLLVEEIANQFNVSTSHLSRIFRENTGITLVEYINIRKVEESQYYLRFSNHKIADISDRFHFCNQSYFTRIFKKYTGQTPKRFRSNLGGYYFQFELPKEHSL